MIISTRLWRAEGIPRYLPPATGGNKQNVMVKKEQKETQETHTDEKYSFDVGNPTELVPVQRPLVITPRSGSWANDEQAAFARTLNGYAYKNPEKWEKKKEVLLAQLERLADHPEELLRVNGNPQAARVEFRNTAVTL